MSAQSDKLRELVVAIAAKLPGLDHAAAVFCLSRFERDVLVMAAGCELDTAIAEAVARAQDDPLKRLPTLRLALGTLDGAAWDALAPDAPLRHYVLIEQAPAMSLVDAQYRIAERVLHALLGVETLDAELAGIVKPSAGAARLTPANQRTLEELIGAWSLERQEWPVIVLSGADHAAKRAIAGALARSRALDVRRIDVTALDCEVAQREHVARLCEREAALSQFASLIELDDELESSAWRAALHWLDEVNVATILCVRERLRLDRRAVCFADVELPDSDGQRALWDHALGDRIATMNGQLDRVVSQFALDADAIARIGSALSASNDGRTDDLWQRARDDARVSFGSLADRLPARGGWDRLVLPQTQLDALHEIVAHVRQRARVYERWGFSCDGRGLGVTTLFAGPSGTGKTLAAEVLANELGLDAYRIDLSQVVSKYIGETEKNLRRVFDAAETGGAVLVFDEADALFGKRAEVRDSHDRYANIEISYLLQRMEAYRGLAILTTNFKSALDEAFLRRLRFVVEFPFPDSVQRAAIWERMFPAEMPRSGLALERLAQLNVTGGNIRNIALHAAFVAADLDSPVTMVHLLRAARTEYAKIGRPIGEAELAGWRS